MKLETFTTPQASRHTSILGLMYGHQFDQHLDLQRQGAMAQDYPGHRELVEHILDFCDCV